MKIYNLKYACTGCVIGSLCSQTNSNSGDIIAFNDTDKPLSDDLQSKGVIYKFNLNTSRLILDNSEYYANLYIEIYKIDANGNMLYCNIERLNINSSKVAIVTPPTPPRPTYPPVVFPAPGFNAVEQKCYTDIPPIFSAAHPAGYPEVEDRESLHCGEYYTYYSTESTIYKSDNASTYSLYIKGGSKLRELGIALPNQNLSSFQLDYYIPTTCDGDELSGAYRYTSGELRIFKPEYTYSQTIGNLFNVKRGNTFPGGPLYTTPFKVNDCNIGTELYVAPPLMYGIANSDLNYKWTLPSGLQIFGGGSVYQGKGANSFFVYPTNMGSNYPTSQTINLEISWTSPCGRTDKLTKDFTVTYELFPSPIGGIATAFRINNSPYQNDRIFQGMDLSKSTPINNSLYCAGQNTFLRSPRYNTELGGVSFLREWQFSDANGILTEGTDYEIWGTYNKSVDITVAQQNNSINNKIVVGFKLLNNYFVRRGIVQAAININNRLVTQCLTTPWNTLFTKYFFINDGVAVLPRPTVNNSDNLCVSNPVVINSNLLGSRNESYEFYSFSNKLVENTDYTLAGNRATFNRSVFGTNPKRNWITVTPKVITNLNGCGTKISTGVPFTLYDNVINPVSSNELTMSGNCSSGNNSNRVSFIIPADRNTNVTWNYYLWQNNTRGVRINTRNAVNFFDHVTNKKRVGLEIIEPAGVTTDFEIEVVATLSLGNTCASTSVSRIFAIKNAKLNIGSLPIKIEGNITKLPCTYGDNFNFTRFTLENIPAGFSYTNVTWDFYPDVPPFIFTDFEIDRNNTSTKGESTAIIFNDIPASTLNLTAVATIYPECGGSFTKEKTFVLNNNNSVPLAPTISVKNAKPLNQYCSNDIITLEATAQPFVLSHDWTIRGGNTAGTFNVTLPRQRNIDGNTFAIDLSQAPYNQYRYLRFTAQAKNKCAASSSSTALDIERNIIPASTPPTGNIYYIDHAFGRTKNENICNGNNAYFYTDAPGLNNLWYWKIDGTVVATTAEPKLKLPVNFAVHHGKKVTLQTTDAIGCPSISSLESEAITMYDAQAPVLAYDKVNYNVPVSYVEAPTQPGGGTLVNGYATVMFAKNTNSVITTNLDGWKWFEQDNRNSNPNRNCIISNNNIVKEIQNSSYGLAKVTFPAADNTIKELQPSFYPPYPIDRIPICKYIVMAKKTTIDPLDFNKIYNCWSDPYILYTEITGSGPYRKEVLDETQNVEKEIVLDAQVYPNPSEGKITIKLPTETGVLIITDAQGKQVGNYTLTQSDTSLDMAEFPIGLYNLVISTSIKTYTIRLVLTK
ncbi:MAG: T9SS C-terminal target domain-containing protein [Bacteroidetes bacterium]|nr:MAG: T9SS C-terminal target domain-containing protein [Bacteroidota bacterium]